MPRLFVLTGDDLGKTFELLSGATLGRAKDADASLHAASISRHHARLELDESGAWCVTDLGSSNGLFFGGARVERAELVDGDTFRLGDVELRIRLDDTQAEEGGFQLEGDWDESAPAAATTEPAARQASSRARQARAEITRAAAGERKSASGGKVLQYQRLEGAGGILSSDLSQRALPARWLTYFALALVFAGLVWGTFSLTRQLRAGRADAADLEAVDVEAPATDAPYDASEE